MNLTPLSRTLCLAALLTPLSLATAQAQSDAHTPVAPPACNRTNPCPTKTFYLTSVSQQNDANEITTAVRNILDPATKIYLVPSRNAIVVSAPQEQIDLVAKLITELDHPHKSYRLEYTVTEFDNGKRLGTQHYSMTAVSNQPLTLKQGSKIPVATGSFGNDKATTQTQFTYLDVGMNFANTVTELAPATATLKFKVEQSSVAPTTSALGVQDPIVRQAVIEGTAVLTLGKPLILGSLDIPETTRHLDIEAMLTPIN